MVGHAFPIFLGFKGGKAVATFTGAFLYLTPIPALAGIISRFSHLLVHLPELAEIEINPLMTSPDGAIAMDARARLGV